MSLCIIVRAIQKPEPTGTAPAQRSLYTILTNYGRRDTKSNTNSEKNEGGRGVKDVKKGERANNRKSLTQVDQLG